MPRRLESIKLVTVELFEQYDSIVMESKALGSTGSIENSMPLPGSPKAGSVNPQNRMMQLKAQSNMVHILDEFLPKHSIRPTTVSRLKQK